MVRVGRYWLRCQSINYLFNLTLAPDAGISKSMAISRCAIFYLITLDNESEHYLGNGDIGEWNSLPLIIHLFVVFICFKHYLCTVMFDTSKNKCSRKNWCLTVPGAAFYFFYWLGGHWKLFTKALKAVSMELFC